MSNLFWRITAKVLAKPAIAQYLIERAKKTPYSPIVKDGDVYMDRFWLLNPYETCDGQQMGSRYPWFPWNVRIHHIRRPDQDRHLHDHPWNARTIILKGYYDEQRLDGCVIRKRGDTARLNFGEYHRIITVSAGGTWTLFISGPYQGTWGFLVDGVKVRWRTYLDLD